MKRFEKPIRILTRRSVTQLLFGPADTMLYILCQRDFDPALAVEARRQCKDAIYNPREVAAARDIVKRIISAAGLTVT